MQTIFIGNLMLCLHANLKAYFMQIALKFFPFVFFDFDVLLLKIPPRNLKF